MHLNRQTTKPGGREVGSYRFLRQSPDSKIQQKRWKRRMQAKQNNDKNKHLHTVQYKCLLGRKHRVEKNLNVGIPQQASISLMKKGYSFISGEMSNNVSSAVITGSPALFENA